MYRLLFILLFSFVDLWAYIDSDMDGVPDQNDSCPNTPMTDLVDLSGCAVKSLLSPHNFTFMAGENYATDSDVSYNFTSLELDYYYKDISLQISTAYYSVESAELNSSGSNDTYVNLFYNFSPKENFSLSLGLGIALPTYNNGVNKTDYSSSFYGRYYLNDWTFATGVGYTLVGESNTNNILFYNVTTGYSWNSKFYSSLGYYFAESMFDNIDNFESLSLYNYYSINKDWFTSLTYTYGLSAISLDKSIGVKLGYYW